MDKPTFTDKQPHKHVDMRDNNHKIFVFSAASGWDKKKKLILASLLILFSGFILFLILKGVNKPTSVATKSNVAFTINSTDYSKDDYEKVLARKENKVLSSKVATDAYIELEKSKYAADKVGIKASSKDLNTLSKKYFKSNNFEKLTTVQQNSIYQLTIENKLDQTQAGDFSGYLFVFPFGKTIPHDSGEPIPGSGDETALKNDQQYAKNKADELMSKLKSGEITDDEALKLVQSDNKLRYFNSSNDSVKFASTKDKPWLLQVRNRDMTYKIQGLENIGISSLFTFQIRNTKTYKMQDMGYYFIDLKGKGSSNEDIGATYRHILETMEVVRYV